LFEARGHRPASRMIRKGVVAKLLRTSSSQRYLAAEPDPRRKQVLSNELQWKNKCDSPRPLVGGAFICAGQFAATTLHVCLYLIPRP
jgi:hypothetical protein